MIAQIKLSETQLPLVQAFTEEYGLEAIYFDERHYSPAIELHGSSDPDPEMEEAIAKYYEQHPESSKTPAQIQAELYPNHVYTSRRREKGTMRQFWGILSEQTANMLLEDVQKSREEW